MPASATWVSTPNKTDNLKSGYTTKVLFNYQYTSGTTVGTNQEIFDKIINSFGKQFRGSNTLPADYFDKFSDGRGFRIVMYFERPFDGNDLDIQTGIYDLTNATGYTIANQQNTYTMVTDTGNSMVRYESYLSFFTDLAGSPDYYISATGAILFNCKPGPTTAFMIPHNNYVQLTGGPTCDYRLQLANKGADIYVHSLMLEEVR